MSLKKLWTALRGATNEGIEAAVDTQSIRILDQELREAKKELQACDENLTKIMAKRKLAENKVNALRMGIETYTNHAIAASEKGDEALASSESQHQQSQDQCAPHGATDRSG